MYLDVIKEVAKTDKIKADSMLKKYGEQKLFFFSKRTDSLINQYDITEYEKDILLSLFKKSEEPPKTSKSMHSYWLLSGFNTHVLSEELINVNDDEYLTILGWLRIYWSITFRAFVDEYKFILAARYVLKKQRNAGDKTAFIYSAEDDLVRELKEILPKAEKFIGLPVTVETLLNPTITRGIMEFDTKMLAYFQDNNIGPQTGLIISELKSVIESDQYNIEERIDVWNNPLLIAIQIAHSRWIDKIQRYTYEKKINPPATSIVYADQVIRTLTKGAHLNKDGNKLLDASGKVISAFKQADCKPINQTACAPIEMMELFSRTHIDKLSSQTAHCIKRFFQTEAHKQYCLWIKNPYTVEVDRGYYGVGDLSGIGEEKDTIQLIEKVMSLLSGCRLQYPDGDMILNSSLIIFEHSRPKRKKAGEPGAGSRLIVTLARPLCPGFVIGLPKGNSRDNYDRMLVPLLEKLPTLIGRGNDRASQIVFQDRMAHEMRLRGTEYYERGGIHLPIEGLRKLAMVSGMPISIVERVKDCWLADGSLEMIGDCIYNLGPKYAGARDMLREAGEREFKGAIAGRKKKNAQRKIYMGSPKET